MNETIYEKLNAVLAKMQEELQKETAAPTTLLAKWLGRLERIYRDERNATHKQDLPKALTELLHYLDKGTGQTGFQLTGFQGLDQLLGGCSNGELIVLGGRPAMGKTDFLISLLASYVQRGVSVDMFTLDSTLNRISTLLVSNITGISQYDLRERKLTEEDFEKAAGVITDLQSKNFRVSNSVYTIEDLIREATHSIREHGTKVILIDNLQLLRSKDRRDNTREAEIAKICRELKSLAVSYGVIVVVTSQLSRAVEMRGGDKKPMLSDLRESGAIEQDADKVLFLYRPEYYGITIDEHGDSTACMAVINIAKNREGRPGSYRLKYFGSTATFSDPEKELPSAPTYEMLLELRKKKFGDEFKP